MNDNKIIFAEIKTLDNLEGEEWRPIRDDLFKDWK